MAFMTPDYTNVDFAVLERANGESEHFPLDVLSIRDLNHDDVITIVKGLWFARLSAAGYMDSTDWSGPFESLEDARQHIKDMFEVDPDTGEDLCGGES